MDGIVVMEKPWLSVVDDPPTDGVVVQTKLDDANGERNRQLLKRRGYLWFVPDGTMYVYYTPTHWREIEATYEI